MAEVIKKLGNMISTAVHMDFDADDSAATSTFSADDSKPLPELPRSNQPESQEQTTDEQVPEANEEQDTEVSRSHIDATEPPTSLSKIIEDVGGPQHVDFKIVIERQVQVPLPLVDQVNVVFPSLSDDIKHVLGDDYAMKEDSSVDDRQEHGSRHLKATNPERYTDLPADFTPEIKEVRQNLTDEVRDFGGGYYLHPKKIVEIPPQLSHQIRSLHDDLNQEVVHGADVLHPKEIVEIPRELDQDIRGLHDALNQEVVNGADVLHPKEIAEIPAELSLEVQQLQKELNEEVMSGADVLHPKQIAEIPPELDHQVRSLHDDLNQVVVHGADLLHPKQIVEVPRELSQDIRGLHDALNQEVVNGADVLHPKEIAEIPAELSLEVQELQKELNEEVMSGADVLHPKQIAEIPPELGQEAKDLRGALNEEVKRFGDFDHLHPKQIVEIPAELSQETEKLHEALNDEVIQAGGPKHLHPKQIVEIPAEISPEIRYLHSDLTEEVNYVGGQQILHPKTIAEIPADLSEEVKYLHEDLNSEVKQIGPNLLHPKQIAEIPKELCQEAREAHVFLAEEVKHGADLLHPKEIAEIPAEINQQTRDLHKDLNVEVALFGGANRLQEESGMDRSTEPPKEISESVKQMLPSLNAEIKQSNARDKLNYNRNTNDAPKLSVESFQAYVEQMLLLFGAPDSGLVLSTDNKAASDNPTLDEGVNNVVTALMEAAKKLRGPSTDNDVLMEELHRRRSIIDVDDGAPAREQREEVENGKPLVDEKPNDANQNAKEPPSPHTSKSDAVDDKEVLKKNKLMRRLSGWKASHATLNDEGDASEPSYTHLKGSEMAKDTNGKHTKNDNRQGSPGRKLRWNPFRKHHRQHVNESVPVI